MRRYGAVSAIPTDPYDIPVALAKRLLGYDRTIHLSSSEQRRYEAAVAASGEHGPCCCHCWRWPMFEGQAKFLLTQLRHTPRQVAQIWDLEDGCGGSV